MRCLEKQVALPRCERGLLFRGWTRITRELTDPRMNIDMHLVKSLL